MTATINGHAILSLEIREPRAGAWVAEIDIDADEAFTDKLVTIDVDGVQWKGALWRGAHESGRFHAVVLGGAGALPSEIGAKHYVEATVRLVLDELCRASGEVLSSTVSADVLNTFVPRWSRHKATVGTAFREIAQTLDLTYRVLRDGTIWLGTESWPAAPDDDYTTIETAPARGRMIVAPQTPFLTPGMVFQGGRIAQVVTRVGGSTRQVVLFEDVTVASAAASDAQQTAASAAASANAKPTPSTVDRSLEPMVRLVEGLVGQRIDHAQWYPAQVVQQLNDGTLDLLPDDERVRGDGISRVPLRHGIPGCKIKVKPGTRVCLFFEDNDAAKPAAGLWPTGEGVLEIELTCDDKLTLIAPTVRVEGELEVTGDVTAQADTTPKSLALHKHPTAMGPSGPPPFPNP